MFSYGFRVLGFQRKVFEGLVGWSDLKIWGFRVSGLWGFRVWRLCFRILWFRFARLRSRVGFLVLEDSCLCGPRCPRPRASLRIPLLPGKGALQGCFIQRQPVRQFYEGTYPGGLVAHPQGFLRRMFARCQSTSHRMRLLCPSLSL